MSVLRRHRRDPHAVENIVEKGTPDVEFINGQIECKAVTVWPKQSNTSLRVPHFTREQRIWLARRCRLGGNAFVILRVGMREHLLFRGDIAAKYLGYAPRDVLVQHALAHWPDGLIEEEFMRCVTKLEPAGLPLVNES